MDLTAHRYRHCRSSRHPFDQRHNQVGSELLPIRAATVRERRPSYRRSDTGNPRVINRQSTIDNWQLETGNWKSAIGR